MHTPGRPDQPKTLHDLPRHVRETLLEVLRGMTDDANRLSPADVESEAARLRLMFNAGRRSIADDIATSLETT